MTSFPSLPSDFWALSLCERTEVSIGMLYPTGGQLTSQRACCSILLSIVNVVFSVIIDMYVRFAPTEANGRYMKCPGKATF